MVKFEGDFFFFDGFDELFEGFDHFIDIIFTKSFDNFGFGGSNIVLFFGFLDFSFELFNFKLGGFLGHFSVFHESKGFDNSVSVGLDFSDDSVGGGKVVNLIRLFVSVGQIIPMLSIVFINNRFGFKSYDFSYKVSQFGRSSIGFSFDEVVLDFFDFLVNVVVEGDEVLSRGDLVEEVLEVLDHGVSFAFFGVVHGVAEGGKLLVDGVGGELKFFFSFDDSGFGFNKEVLGHVTVVHGDLIEGFSDGLSDLGGEEFLHR